VPEAVGSGQWAVGGGQKDFPYVIYHFSFAIYGTGRPVDDQEQLKTDEREIKTACPERPVNGR
jgi:hypothetical protein